ncbi:MAG: AMP-binding protein [Microbacteriaceae bacterium]|jgi:O-succinylbenzoic acid--CoA ligase
MMSSLDDARRALGVPGAPGTGVLIETSGTTGEAKRVRLSSGALRASAEASHARLGGPGQWLLALPTTYIAGANVLVRSVIAATEPVVMPAGHFTARDFADCVALMTGARRYSSLVPVQLARLVEGAQYDDAVRSSVATLDAILVGGQASGDQLLARARELGWKIVVTYGATETCGGVVYDGAPLDGSKVRIISGEIWIGGSTLAVGYERADGSPDTAQTQARFTELDGERWYRTDDAGEFEVSGAFAGELVRVTGRRDRVIISGGIKVSLLGIEAVVRTVPGVADCVAAAIPNEEWGQRPILGVECDPGVVVSQRDVERAIETALGHVSVPDVIVFGSLPRNENGKPDTRALTASIRR